MGPHDSRLLARWCALLRTVAPGADATDVRARGVDLLTRYAEPHRRYHDVRHLAEVLAAVDELRPYAACPATVELAAWFHDAVYEPTREDSEERSAVLAARSLAALGVGPPTDPEVGRLVRLTATHAATSDDPDAAVLCDADLAVLAAGEDRYAEYAAGVRAEFAHVPDDAFRAGRVAVLTTLLTHPVLYVTEAAHTRHEARARANVTAEIGRLTAGSATAEIGRLTAGSATTGWGTAAGPGTDAAPPS